jgi:Ca2+-binding RTX toxin-like protein
MSGISTDLGTGNDTWPGPEFPGQGNGLNDSIFGNSGNDTIDGGPGDDFCPGGASFETVVAAAHP